MTTNTTVFTFIVEFFIFSVLNSCLNIDKVKRYVNKLSLRKIFFYTTIFYLAIISFLKFEVGDVMLFSSAGKYLKNRIDFYWIDSNHSQYPFFPFLIFFHAILNTLSEKFTFFSFSHYLKIFLLIPAFYLIIKIIYTDLKKQSKVNPKLAILKFITSPIVYCVVLFHGQIDVILLALFMLSSRFVISRQRNWRQLVTGAILYALSIASKTWSILFLPAIIVFQRNAYLSSSLLLIVIICLMANIYIYTRYVFGSSFSTVIPALSKPGGPVGVWGISYLLPLNFNSLQLFKRYSIYLFGALFGLIQLILIRYFNLLGKVKDCLSLKRIKNYFNYKLIKHLSFRDNYSIGNYFEYCFLTVVGIYIVIPNWGIQYLFWVLPFLFYSVNLLENQRTNNYMLIANLYCMASYLNIAANESIISESLVNLLGFSLWCYCIYWFSVNILRLKSKTIG